MTTSTALIHALGATEDGDDFTFDLRHDAHALLVGGTGSGKSIAAKLAARTFSDEGAAVVILDKIGEEDAFRYLTPGAQFITEKTEQAQKISGLHQEMQDRYAGGSLEEHRPILLVIDSVEDLFAGLSADQSEKLEHEIRNMLRIGRSARIHLIVTTQMYNADTPAIGGAEPLDNFGLVALFSPTMPQRETLLFGEPHPAPQERMTALGRNRFRGVPVTFKLAPL